MVTAIVPGAGSSRRMGRPKLLLPFRDGTVLGATVAALRAGGAEAVVVVTAPTDLALAAWCAEHACRVAINPDPERGMLSSLWAGIAGCGGAAAFADDESTLLVSPGDLPLLRPATVAAVLTALAPALGHRLAQPRHGGRNGHPLAIAGALVSEILALDLDAGLRQLRERQAASLVAIEVDDAGCVHDVDTPADYDRLRDSATGGD